MNSYNENLHVSVLETLNEQELKLQKSKANLDASMFSLYYAEGARITAAEELIVANDNYKFQQSILEQAVIDSDLSTNVLSSVELANKFIPETVKNTSVAAANVQIAANAILKLASDVGSIFSIVTAADFDTEIYDQSKYANDLMNGSNPLQKGTAYLAEKTSQLSMEASAEIAEVPVSSLAEKTTATDTSIKALLEVVNTDFSTASEAVMTDTETLATSNSAEKKAEGNLEDAGVIFKSNKNAYALTNKQLNLNVNVKIPEEEGKPTKYEVSFNKYKSPFGFHEEIEGVTKGIKMKGYPVNEYYIFLVKNQDKEFFSLSDAEGLITENESKKLYLKIASTGQDSYTQVIDISKVTSEETEDNASNKVADDTGAVLGKTELKDVNGNDIKVGENYVVYVFAVFEAGYKKIINTFDDYLSAPSAYFTLKNRLTAPAPKKIVVKNNKMVFRLDEASPFEVEYRCLFLLLNPSLTKGLLTAKDLKKIEEAADELSDYYKKNKEAATLKSKLKSLSLDIEALNVLTANESKGSELKKIEALEKEKEKLEAELKKVEKEIAKLSKDINKPGFFFNYTIAKGLEIESYALASEDSEKEYSLSINALTTDSFGNSLIINGYYIPVVLAMPKGNEEEVEFIGALSNIQETTPFTYTVK